MNLIRAIILFLTIFCVSTTIYGDDKKSQLFIRVLLGERPISNTEIEMVKKVSAKAIMSGATYQGEIELWKGQNGYFLINVVNLEDYVKGVVASEVGIHWPPEALKAQAVLARTYAVAHILRNRGKNFYDVTSSVFHQVFKGDGSSEEIDRAVKETEGEILTYNNEPIMAFYHACSVEKTEDPKEVFDRDYPYLRAIEVPFTPSPYNFWEKKISFDLLGKVLSLENIRDAEILSHTSTGRIKDIKFTNGKESKVIKATDLRKLLNWTALPSTMITSLRVEDDGVVFEGRGFGHGVGMCQWCAFQMAQEGKNYKEILEYFYPGTKLTKIE